MLVGSLGFLGLRWFIMCIGRLFRGKHMSLRPRRGNFRPDSPTSCGRSDVYTQLFAAVSTENIGKWKRVEVVVDMGCRCGLDVLEVVVDIPHCG